MKNKIEIFVLTHKKFELPLDNLYKLLLNGSITYEDDFGLFKR